MKKPDREYKKQSNTPCSNKNEGNAGAVQMRSRLAATEQV